MYCLTFKPLLISRGPDTKLCYFESYDEMVKFLCRIQNIFALHHWAMFRVRSGEWESLQSYGDFPPPSPDKVEGGRKDNKKDI